MKAELCEVIVELCYPSSRFALNSGLGGGLALGTRLPWRLRQDSSRTYQSCFTELK